jgi:hypothetical protein
METVKILSWTIAAVVVTILIARQVTKAIVFRKIGLDDSFILIAAVSQSKVHLALELTRLVTRHRLIGYYYYSRSERARFVPLLDF